MMDAMADPAHPKIAQTDHEVLDVIRLRWSPRAFDAARDVAEADLWRLFEAARWAPSSRNEQPWRFVVASRARTPDAFAAMLASLTPRNQAWATAAPVLVIIAVRLTHEIDDLVNSHAWYDAGQAVAFLALQATALGLSTRQMQGFDLERARLACEVPPPFEPAVLMAIGYAGDAAKLSYDKHRAAEAQPRERRPISDFVFEGRWGRPLRHRGPDDRRLG
jgi:nitroreductase